METTYYIVRARDTAPGQPVEALRAVRGPRVEADKIARILSVNSLNGGYMAVSHVDTIPEGIPDDSTSTMLRYYAALGMGE